MDALDQVIKTTLNALSPLQTLMIHLWNKVPAILAALLLLLVGSFLGRWLRHAAEKVFDMMNLDDVAEKVGISNILSKLGMGKSPAVVVGFLVYWLVFLAFLLSAANVIQLTVVSEFLQQVVLFLPKLIAAILVLGGGFLLGHFAGEIVFNAARANGIKGSDILAKITTGTLIVFSAIMALERLGIDASILSRSVQIIIGSACLGVALAFGLSFGMAGKETAAKWIADLTKKR